MPVPARSLLLCALLMAASTSMVAPTASAEPFATPAGAERAAVTPTPDIGDRSTIVHRPANAGPGSPLVVMLHGKNSNGATMQATTDMDTAAARYGFVTAYPNADKGLWSADDCCRTASMRPVDDIGFLHTLVNQLVLEDSIDPARVYAVGFSAGGILTYKWACERNDLAAIGVVATGNGNACTTPTPLTVVAVHGTRDNTFPINGGTSSTGKRIPSLDESIAPFLTANGCTTPSPTQVTGRMSVTTWACTNTHAVVRAVVKDNGHTWPGNPTNTVYPTSTAETSDFIWARMTATY